MKTWLQVGGGGVKTRGLNPRNRLQIQESCCRFFLRNSQDRKFYTAELCTEEVAMRLKLDSDLHIPWGTIKICHSAEGDVWI